ncbi:MAG: entericidin [Burkholderiales bacterium RIFCSPHIGHO2_12_FULL_69_20]|nr:MAG: entericidin [Burkholderiales bacterium RIFCSPHIGHO2_12_FULL_69_20]
MTRLILIVSAVLALSACNTVKGIGQDVQKTGQVIEGAAKK